MGELMGRTSGLSGGKGGTFHMFAPRAAFLRRPRHARASARRWARGSPSQAGTATTARSASASSATTPRAGALSSKPTIAAEWKLPIVFVIDNNAGAPGSSIVLGTMPSAMSQAGVPFAIPRRAGRRHRRAQGPRRRHALPSNGRGDGEGPTILEMLTYRYRGHVASRRSARRKEARRDRGGSRWPSRERGSSREQDCDRDGAQGDREGRARRSDAAARGSARSAPRAGTDPRFIRRPGVSGRASSAMRNLAMQRQVLMPALSPSMTDGKIARWHVAEGQSSRGRRHPGRDRDGDGDARARGHERRPRREDPGPGGHDGRARSIRRSPSFAPRLTGARRPAAGHAAPTRSSCQRCRGADARGLAASPGEGTQHRTLSRGAARCAGRGDAPRPRCVSHRRRRRAEPRRPEGDAGATRRVRPGARRHDARSRGCRHWPRHRRGAVGPASRWSS